MIYLQAPAHLDSEFPAGYPSLFLAGGITNCPDWQADATNGLAPMPMIIINPLQENFPMGDPEAGLAQIVWEHHYLHFVDAILFWFPEETLCPIALFELGSWLKTDKPLFIGCHPNYGRRFDVQVQVSLARRDQVVHDHLGDVLADVRHWIAPETYF